MTVYVADTHSLLWYLAGSPQLSSDARAALDETVSGAAQVVVPAIVIAELVMLAERRRGVFDAPRIVAALRSNSKFLLSPLSPEIALRIQSLTKLSDIHDRLIVAEALAAGASLITRDQAITASGYVPVVW
jgi:PIN domain nuclease of toxin-antitoxin system